MRLLGILLPSMIFVHAVDGRGVAVNTEHITSIAEPGKQVTEKAECLISTLDRKFVSTHETCREVWAKIQHEDAKEK